MRLSDQVATTIRRRIRLPQGARVLAAVSGGADSVALAWLLAELAERGALALVGIAHLNHQLRGADADADEAFVAALADRLRVPFDQMVFVGDGYTDIPCFSLIRSSGGVAFGVWDPRHRDKRNRAWGFIEDGRVSNLNHARYDDDAELYQWLEEALTSIAGRVALKARIYRG